MRTEKEMFQLITETAEKDDRVLAVGLNGSRTNNKAPKDLFQDYDIVYVVESVEAFVKDPSWIDQFGLRLIMQTPEDMVLFSPTENGRFTYLMLFDDGNRIDLTLCPKEQAEFLDCCNEFWWVSTYVVKGLCRNELFYAADHLNEICQKELLRLLSWQVGSEHGYQISVGKNYKYLPNYLMKEEYEAILATMNSSSISSIWSALISLQKQFDYYAQKYAQKNRFDYDQKPAIKVMNYTKDFSASC